MRGSGPILFQGPWKLGFALDLHTVESSILGVDEFGQLVFDTRRTELGELLYKLKYKGQRSAVYIIVDRILEKVRGLKTIDLIVPIPASNPKRPVNAALEIAKELGARTGIRVGAEVLYRRMSTELKNIEDIEERRRILTRALDVSCQYNLREKNILLIDDIFRSGITLEAATTLLYERGAQAVVAMTITKTRTKR